MKGLHRILHRPFFIRLFNWEFWSFRAIYFCIYPLWVVLALRARSFFFFSAANPSIKNGGFLNESKKEIYGIMPAAYYPKTSFFSSQTHQDQVIRQLNEEGLSFPMIGKPDIGGRGRGVRVFKTETDIIEYVKKASLDFHIQEYVLYKNEVGIFYYRYPGEHEGKISGIVKKEFLSVRGDGVSTIRSLILSDKRSLLQLKSLQKMYGDGLNEVLAHGVQRMLVPYGNHARGALFLDHSFLIDEELNCTIDKICRNIDGFYFGRLDIRYKTWEELKSGKNFIVIEANGAGAEPTHIYDPRHSLFFAWKEIIRHWWILCTISRKNHLLGHPYLTVREGLQMFREDKLNSQKLALMPE